MRITDIKPILETICPRVAYDHFNTPQDERPFIAYGELRRSDLYADNRNFCGVISGYIELYTDFKDVELEAELEKTLEKQKLPFEKETEAHVESEDMFMNRWRFVMVKED